MKLKYLSFLFFVFYLVLTFYLVKIIPLDSVFLFVTHLGFFGPFVFYILYLIRGFIRFPELLFLLALPHLFSIWITFPLYVLSVITSTSLLYGCGHYLRNHKSFLITLRKKLEENKTLHSKIQTYGVWGVIPIHFFGLASFDIVNLVSGYVKSPYVKYISVVCATKLSALLVYSIVLAFI